MGIAGVGRESVRGTVELAETAAESRYDAVLVRTPTYYAPAMSEAASLFWHLLPERWRTGRRCRVILYNIPRFAPYNIPVPVVAELAQHPNIIGIKDSTGSVEHVRELIEATRTAPKRTVPVTTIFEPVTGRMLAPKLETESGFVPLADLSGGVAMAVTQPSTLLKTRMKEVGFQVLAGSAGTLLESLEAGAAGGVLAFAACAPQACQEVYIAWKDHDLELARAKSRRESPDRASGLW